jgi:simple sugar transport system ATP-binding protein
LDIELRGITKRFGAVVANSDVNLKIRAGEILGLLGENGAGKSTLMNVLSGLYRPDEGEILIDGKPVNFRDAKDAIHAGIGMVHQHFMLVPVFTVAENVVLGVEPTAAFDRLDLAKARRQVSEISAAHGLEVDPDAIIEEIPVGLQQRVEIIKVLFRSANVIIFDEPTAVLTPQEVTEFFGIIRSLRDAGKALVFITHKLGEVLEVADRISVLRGGKVVGDGDPKTATEAELAEMMVGRAVQFEVEKKPAHPGRPLLEARGLAVVNEREELAVDGVDLAVHEGEVVGIAGVQGNGQTELVEALTGLRSLVRGTVAFLGEDITTASTRKRHRLGIAHIPEDRQHSGIIGEFDIAENMVLDSYYDWPYSSGALMHWSEVHKVCVKNVIDFDVRTPSIYSLADHLSGGNQQKLIASRELSRGIKLLIAAQPTRGIDVGSIEYIHKRIIQARDSGVGVLIVSTELDEILSLSDRILVMFRGRIVGEFEGGKVSKSEIGLAMAGVAA